MKYSDFHLEENLERTNFISTKNTSQMPKFIFFLFFRRKSILKIKSVSPIDQGVYSCSAHSILGYVGYSFARSGFYEISNI
jgi:hypothetical protein